MSLIGLIVVLVVLGVALYCINALIPMDSKIKMILNVVVVLVVIVWLIQALGLLGPLDNVRIR